MIELAAANYGPLQNVVSGATTVLAAVGALRLAFGGRANWQPPDQEYPKLLDQVALTIAASAVVVLWISARSIPPPSWLGAAAVASSVGVLVFGLIYIVSTATLIYEREELGERPQRIIGGFVLTAEAQAARKARHVTVQQLFKGAGYDRDTIWPRWSQALGKATLALSYVLLTATGTVAVATLGILIAAATA